MKETGMRKRRARSAVIIAAVVVVVVSAGVAAVAADFVYVMFVLGAWTPNHWLDRAHISRQTSMADTDLGFVRKPGVLWKGSVNGYEVVYRTDENGFRNPPGIEHADAAFIGDSYTEAAHIPEEQTFVARLARDTGLRTVNLGRGAYGPQQELIVLRRYALRYEPKTIVWQFFTGNDLNDADEFATWVARGRPHDTPLLTRYINSSLIRRVLKSELNLPSRGTALARVRYSDGRTDLLRLRYEREPPLLKLGAAEIRRALEEGARICRENGITLVVFTVPTMLHILQPYIRFENAADQLAFVANRSADRRSEFTSWLNQTCDAIPGCSFVDVWSALHEEAGRDNRRLYIPNDEHLDVRGHEIIARKIAGKLQGAARSKYHAAAN
jgi:hypothetical protein